MGEISGLAISGLRKKLADSTSANPLILDSILKNITNLHLKYSNSYILVYHKCFGQKTSDYSWGRLSEALGNWGSGNLEGGGFGERVETGEVSWQATWDRGGRILSQLGGFQVSRKGVKGGSKGESAKGDKKQGECAMYIAICARVHKECLERLNDTSCIYA